MIELFRLAGVPTQMPSNGPVTFTLIATNSCMVDTILEDFVDTLPTTPGSPTYVAGSSRYNGVAITDPTISGSTLTWIGSFAIPAGARRSLTFQVSLPAINGAYTNRAVATILIAPGGIVFDSSTGLPVANAIVTLLDASSGLPALVYQSNGRSPSPNPVTTGPDGVYLFPCLLPGGYQLQVLPPPGYRSPSKVPLDRLPGDRTIANPGSFGGRFKMSF